MGNCTSEIGRLTVEDEPLLTDLASTGQRERILRAALDLLAQGSRDALTTRAVAEAAGVQPPILYRLFHDKAGLLRAVADFGFAMYLANKRPPHTTEDPIDFLRDGWARHVEFGLAHPELYLLMYANPQPDPGASEAWHAHPGLRAHMHRIALAGRLRVPEDLATQLFHGAACGTVMTLLGTRKNHRNPALSTASCEAALAAIVTDPPVAPEPLPTAAITLRALLTASTQNPVASASVLTPAEHNLLLEWLDRLATPSHPSQ